MFEASDLKKGLKVLIDGNPCVITHFDFMKPGKGQAVIAVIEKYDHWKYAR